MEKIFDNGFNYDVIERNSYLKTRDIAHFWKYNYLSDKYGYDSVDGKVSRDIRTLKNQFRDERKEVLQSSAQRIETELSEGLNFLVQQLVVVGQPWVVVAVPRSKATFCDDQLYLIKAISNAALHQHLENGAYFIERHSDTKTTHLMNTKIGDMNKTGEAPYPGITYDTCNLCGEVRGKNIILVDDIYTHNINVDEDCAQFLFDNGAKDVVLYTLCKTTSQY